MVHASLIETLIAPAPLTSPAMEPALLEDLLTDVDECGQVTVHCSLHSGPGDAIRIWPSTYLVCRQTGHRSKLVHAERIPFAPLWQPLLPGRTVSFTLLFEALPDDCILFDLVEDIHDESGFFTPAILRNSMDVYRVDV
jgi:hypothetical protein